MAFTGRVLPLKQGSEAYRAIRVARNKLTSDGSESVCFGAAAASQPPLPFRRSKRRSGRIPAEP